MSLQIEHKQFIGNGHLIDRPEQAQNVIAHHTTPEQAGTVFSQVKPKLSVYSHIVPGDAPNLISLTRKTYSAHWKLAKI